MNDSERKLYNSLLLLDNLWEKVSELVHRVSDFPVDPTERRNVPQPL